MKHKFPDASQKEGIKSVLQETFWNRRNWITETGPAISEILDSYKRLLDYKGDMVSIIFVALKKSQFTPFSNFK